MYHSNPVKSALSDSMKERTEKEYALHAAGTWLIQQSILQLSFSYQ